VIVAGVALWLANLSPSQAIARRLPDGVRAKLGEQVVASMTGDKKVCSEAAGSRALETLVTRLTGAAGHDKPFKVIVVDWGLVNAFATPGEQIVLTRGLINKAESPDEVAGVLGHEMGHGIEMHPETGVVRAIGLSAAMELMVGGGGGTLGNMGLMLAQLSYTREAEREADQHALSILRKAAISPRGFGDFFRRVSGMEGTTAKSSRAFDILSSHPPSEERRRLVERQADYPATPALDSTEWQALREICGELKPGTDPSAADGDTP
jgi:predicted Zn-dependent protease